MDKRLHVCYTGEVQGVGFRFTAERLGVSLGLAGWVRNLSDGRVEIACEGKEEALKEFLNKINDVFKRYIKDADVTWAGATGEFEGFEVRFY